MAEDEGTSGLGDFFGKIEWEGGVDEALDYGLTTVGYDLPPDIKSAWDSLVELRADYEKRRNAALNVIEAAML